MQNDGKTVADLLRYHVENVVNREERLL
ncbi:hypothetical protein [Scytonema sp. NUACC26]